mgnify:CR=1 FL=1
MEVGQKVIGVRWIDINKGDTQNPNYRSRLVAREINTSKRMDLFAATPPLEALKLVLSILTSGNKGEKLMINDVSRAFFCAPARRQVFVELPDDRLRLHRLLGLLEPCLLDDVTKYRKGNMQTCKCELRTFFEQF